MKKSQYVGRLYCRSLFDKKCSHEHVPNSEWLPRQSCLYLQIPKHNKRQERKRNYVFFILF